MVDGIVYMVVTSEWDDATRCYTHVFGQVAYTECGQ